MTKAAQPGDFAVIADLDRLVHEPARLAILALLYVVESGDFTFVMNQTGLTWGNLSAHVSKLEEAGYVVVEKAFKGKRPNTKLRLSKQGRGVFTDYVEKLKNLLPSAEKEPQYAALQAASQA